MEFPAENSRGPRGLSPETHFIKPAADCVSGGDRAHVTARTRSHPGTISRRSATHFAARRRVATGLPRLGNHWRKALSYAAVSSKASCAAFHLSLSKLPPRFSSCAQDQTGGGMFRMLPRTQRRRIRRAVSAAPGKVAQASSLVTDTTSKAGGMRYSFSAFCPRNLAWINMSISPSITACTLLVSAPVR